VALGLGVAVPRMGFSLFPKAEKPQFLVNVELPNSAGLPETDRVTRDVERVLARHPDIIHYTTNVGKGQPSIYYNVPQRNEQPNFAQIFVQCRAETYEEKNALVQRLRRELATYPNARVEVKDFEQGPPLEAPVAVRIFGDNLDTLRQLSFRVERELRAVLDDDRADLAEGLRMAVHRRYLVFCREIPGEGAVRIERVLHGARNLHRLL